MKFEWDPEKSARNKADPARGKGFGEASALWTVDARAIPHNLNSGETVWLRAAHFDGAVWGAMYVVRGDMIRILSFRKLNKRERKKYGVE